jgi:hypothetical protein
MKHIVFLRWVLFAVVVAIAATVLNRMDFLSYLYANDVTRISIVILGISLIFSLWCGFKTYCMSNILDRVKSGDLEEKKELIAKTDRRGEVGWFVSDQIFTLGMIGTVIGFILMMSGFGDLNVHDVNSVQEIIANLASGMATALLTTLVGLICSAIIKVQYFNLDLALAEIKERLGIKDE